jgi:putative FmdB family regulatory protein
MPLYDYYCDSCKQEWETSHSWKDPPLTVCELCNQADQVKRLITMANKGTVELTGQDLKQHIKEETQKFQREVKGNEKAWANVVGEDRYQSQVKNRERR